MLCVYFKGDLFQTDQKGFVTSYKTIEKSMKSYAASQAHLSLDQQNLTGSNSQVNLNEMHSENSRPHLQNVMEKLEFSEIDEILVDLLLSHSYPSTDDLINKRLCLSTEATLPSASKDIASGYSMHHSSKCYHEPVRRPTQPEPWPPPQTFIRRESRKC